MDNCIKTVGYLKILKDNDKYNVKKDDILYISHYVDLNYQNVEIYNLSNPLSTAFGIENSIVDIKKILKKLKFVNINMSAQFQRTYEAFSKITKSMIEKGYHKDYELLKLLKQ